MYLPCVLQTKKRYVGFSYETESQKEPIFDAKGIETVRRDSCPMVAKMLEQSLRIVFNTKDLSQLKSYLRDQVLFIIYCFVQFFFKIQKLNIFSSVDQNSLWISQSPRVYFRQGLYFSILFLHSLFTLFINFRSFVFKGVPRSRGIQPQSLCCSP